MEYLAYDNFEVDAANICSYMASYPSVANRGDDLDLLRLSLTFHEDMNYVLLFHDHFSVYTIMHIYKYRNFCTPFS